MQNVPITSARSVAWWPVLIFVADYLGMKPTAMPALFRSLPPPGTPPWCALPDTDPVKLSAVLDTGCRHALRVELAQEARAEASRDISAAADWRKVANEFTSLTAYRAANPWSRGKAS